MSRPDQDCVTGALSQCEDTKAPYEGEKLVRQTSERHRVYIGTVGKIPGPPAHGTDGLRASVEKLDRVLGVQSDLLHQLFSVLNDQGLLKAVPGGPSAGGCQTVATRLSTRVNESADRVVTHNEGLMQILSRLDL